MPSSIDVLTAACENDVAQQLLKDNPSLESQVAIFLAENICQGLVPDLTQLYARADQARTPRGRVLVNEARARGLL